MVPAPPSLSGTRVAGQESSVLRPFAAANIELREIVGVLWRRRAALLAAFGLGVLLAGLSVLFANKESDASILCSRVVQGERSAAICC